jgi:hypothetical protein
MLHPHTKLAHIDDRIGYGVVATRLIPEGTVTWTLDPLDQRIPAAKLNDLDESLKRVLEHYAYFDHRGDYILCWDFARYVNHSCTPTTLAPGIDVEIAVRDIQPGEQLTGDYAAYNLEHELACCCGSPQCRGVIREADFDRLAEKWDTQLRDSVQRVTHVSQPLWSHISDRDVLLQAAADPSHLPSSARHQLPPTKEAALDHARP